MGKKKSKALSWFEESSSDWQEDDVFMLSDEELKSVISCSITAYNGQYGVFIKLFMDIKVKGKILHLMGDEDSDGKKRRGVKLDATSTKRYEYLVDEDDSTLDIEPERVILMVLRNTEDDTLIRRVGITRAKD